MNGGHFGVHQDQNFCKLDYHFLMKVARHVQSNQKRKFIKFLQYIKKKCRNSFVFYCDAKHSDALRGFSIFVVTCFWVVVVKNEHSLLGHGTMESVASQQSELVK